MVTAKKRIRPRSLDRYAESVRVKAREAWTQFSFIRRMGDKAEPTLAMIKGGKMDDMPMVELAGFMIANNGFLEPAGVKCTGCGSSWTDERLADERRRRLESGGPPLYSCCPERKMKAVFWCADAV